MHPRTAPALQKVERRVDPGGPACAMPRSFLPGSYHRRKNEKMMLNTTLMMMQVTIGK